jgi:hypothetical protein
MITAPHFPVQQPFAQQPAGQACVAALTPLVASQQSGQHLQREVPPHEQASAAPPHFGQQWQSLPHLTHPAASQQDAWPGQFGQADTGPVHFGQHGASQARPVQGLRQLSQQSFDFGAGAGSWDRA